MRTIAKMVINRNNLEYLYTEKIQTFDNNIEYLVYHQNKPYSYSKNNFYSTYAEDKKYPIVKFIDAIQNKIIQNNVYHEYIPYIMRDLEKIKEKIITKDRINPSLWGYKNTFVTALNALNSIIPIEQDLTIEHDYEDEYQRINKQEN